MRPGLRQEVNDVNRNKFECLRNWLKEKADHSMARAVTLVALSDSVAQGCMGNKDPL